jgi:hypothetical protein
MRAALQRLAGRRGRFLLLVALAVGVTAAYAAPALAAAKWQITMTHANAYGQEASEGCHTGKPEPEAEPPCGVDPLTELTGDEGAGGNGETFARESAWNAYTITITNTGETTSAGKVTVVDHLPAGMLLAGEKGGEPDEASGGGWTGGENKQCKILAGGVGAECFTEETAAKGESFEPITLHVRVTPQAANPSTNVATVSGGGAVPESVSTTEEEGETKVTEAVPFGIVSFTTNAVESLGNPFSQAGGHPFALSTELLFNYTPSSRTPEPNDNTGSLVSAGGVVKEAQVEVPPGFIGNPQNVPQCPAAALRAEKCPANTAVGYVHVTLGTAHAAIVEGKFSLADAGYLSSKVYNMQPPPGSPAQFGFTVNKGLPFVLEAKVRSDGDYGVTVGDSATGEKPLFVAVTLCENGASGEEHEIHCNPASPSSKPFLTNPTACAGPAPLWRLVANSWEEPADYQSKTVGVNLEAGALDKESLINGCASLDFEPELEFKPSPPSEGGSTQAGEPTGMTLDLKVPQTNEAKLNATPELKNAVVTLPAGMTLSPSAADGLQACSNAQFGLGTEFATAEVPLPPGVKPTEPARPASCPLDSQIGTVEVFTPLLSGAPTIEGVPGKIPPSTAPGELTCLQGTWNGSPTLSYQWLRNGVAIAGANGREYTPVGADEGEALQCQVTATNAGGRSVAVSRDAVGIVEQFKGKIVSGSAIVTGVTRFTGVTVKSELSGSGIAAGTTVISVNEETNELEMSLPATETTTSTITATPVPPFPPASIAAPSGTASVGNTLTCESGAWTGEHEPFTYRWLRGGEEIAGSESEKYTLLAADEGQAIQCQVSAKNAGGVVIADSPALVVSPEPSVAPPLLGAPLQGQLFVGEPECGNANHPEPCTNEDSEDGKLVRVFLQAQDPRAGVIIKQVGKGTLNTLTGQLKTTFSNAPEQPFELAVLKLKGGPRAPLVNPQSCGPATTETDLTPWSAPGLGGLSGSEPVPGTPDAFPSASFEVTGCGPGQFAPTFNAGTTNNQAGAFSPLSLTFSRTDSDQDFEGLTVHTPPGLAGMISNVALCPEAQANAGTCPAASQIGTTTVGSGAGPHPLYLEGKVYLTGPYKGQPFGMSVAVPAIAGPFNLGMVVVRSSIHVDPYTAAITVTSDPFPKILDGIPTHIKQVNVNINREDFIFNPTNCSAQQISATLTSVQGASAQVSSPFGIAGCSGLPFKPTLTASAVGKASKANGASLDVKVTSAGLGQANVAKVNLQFPKALSSRLTTIQKACVASVFEANPAACDEGSVIGSATIHTPVLKSPLSGPAYLVSHGGAAFPDAEFVLQGEGITLVLDGKTDIKNGITYSDFESAPDAPFTSFETVLPSGPHSVFTANVPEQDNFSLCGTTLAMPTTITAQNGAVIKQTTNIAVTGCPPTVAITKTKLTGNTLLVTVKLSAEGTVRISGKGLKTTTLKNLKAGTHQIKVALTKTGRSMRKHHKKTTVHVSLTVGKQAVAKTTALRL